MKKIYNLIYNVVIVLSLFNVVACEPKGERDGEISLSCGEALSIVEGETESISVSGVDDFVFTIDNNNVSCERNASTISITGIKVGDCRLTVTDKDREHSVTCVITVVKSAAQKDFEIISTPRVENWLPETVKTETTDGLQVTCEAGIDAAGRKADGATTFGFYFIEEGAYCRLSAVGDFSVRGKLTNGMIAIQESGAQVQYYLCRTVEVVNVLNGKSWIVATTDSRPDLRIVTEVF